MIVLRAVAIVGKNESREAFTLTHIKRTPKASEFSLPCGRLALPQSVERLQGFTVKHKRGRTGKTRHT